MSDDFRISVRIGAMLDSRSVDATLGDFKKKADKVAAETASTFARAERQRNAQAQRGARERVASERAAEREIESTIRKQVAEERRAQQEIRREHQQTLREAARLRRQEISEANKAANEIARNERRLRQQADRERERFATRTSHRATRFLFPQPEGALGYARRVGHDVMRGMGMDWTLAGGLQRGRDLEEQAQLLSQNAYEPGQKGPAGTRVSAAALIAGARAAAASGVKGGSEEIIAGQSKFVSDTGDLQTARDLTREIAELSLATGAGFTDAMEASAAIANKLGDVPDKARKIAELMRGFAWQGKLGAVEISDMAKSMPRLLSGVTRFEGDLSENMIKLGALAQMARGGPASSAREAATGVARMADLFVTPARIKAMERMGLKHSDIFAKSGAIRDPFEIVKKALDITGGDPLKMKTAFNSIMGARPVERLTDLYRGAGRGAAGQAAVDAEIKRLTSGAGMGMSSAEVTRQAAESASTNNAKARKFQEELDRVADNLRAELLPTLESLEPKIKGLVEAFSFAVDFTSKNLGSAIMLAITGSIARGGLESGFRTIVDRFMGAAGGAVRVSDGFGTLGGAIKNTTLTLGTLAIAFGAATAALNLLDELENKRAVAESKQIGDLDAAYQQSTQNIDANTSLTPEQKQERKAELARQAMKRLEWIEKEQGFVNYLPDWATPAEHQKNKGMEMAMRSQYARDQVTDASARAAAAADPELLARALQGLHVHLDNPQDIKVSHPNSGPPTADRGNAGR